MLTSALLQIAREMVLESEVVQQGVPISISRCLEFLQDSFIRGNLFFQSCDIATGSRTPLGVIVSELAFCASSGACTARVDTTASRLRNENEPPKDVGAPTLRR
jgi:hypothetical protein